MTRLISCLLFVLLFFATTASAGFIPEFIRVWLEGDDGQRQAGGGSAAGSTFTDPTTGMAFVFVKGGCFMMGSNAGKRDEKPEHEVCVDDFWMGKYEVTQKQWKKVTGRNPAQFKKGDSYPVEKVSWNDVQDYLRQLNAKRGKGFGLPSEAEWEYAARSGGRQETYAGGENIDAVAWYTNNSGQSTHPVGQKQPNGLGLYDMSGNVWEWCQDWSDKDYYANSPKYNPQGPSNGSSRVFRGGGWDLSAEGVLAVLRSGGWPGFRGPNLGFRVAFPADVGTFSAMQGGKSDQGITGHASGVRLQPLYQGKSTLPSDGISIIVPRDGSCTEENRMFVMYNGSLIDGISVGLNGTDSEIIDISDDSYRKVFDNSLHISVPYERCVNEVIVNGYKNGRVVLSEKSSFSYKGKDCSKDIECENKIFHGSQDEKNCAACHDMNRNSDDPVICTLCHGEFRCDQSLKPGNVPSCNKCH